VGGREERWGEGGGMRKRGKGEDKGGVGGRGDVRGGRSMGRWVEGGG